MALNNDNEWWIFLSAGNLLETFIPWTRMMPAWLPIILIISFAPRQKKIIITLGYMTCRFPPVRRTLTLPLPLILSITISPRIPRWNKVANQITRSVCDRRATSKMTQIELSITKLTWHSHPDLNNHAYRLWSLCASRCPRDTRDLYCPAPGRCNWWTHSLKIKYILVIFSGRQRMAR
jgi:hypothetical protein